MAETSTDNIIGPFKKRHEKVLLIPGNHETVATADFLAELYDVTNLHGYSIKHEDVAPEKKIMLDLIYSNLNTRHRIAIFIQNSDTSRSHSVFTILPQESCA